MKKLLLSFAGLAFTCSSFAQIEKMEVSESGKFFNLAGTPTVANQAKKPVNDTIIPPGISCTNSISFIDIGDELITGPFNLGNGNFITDVAQILNTDGNSVDVYGLLVLGIDKDQGPNKGSFTASIYDTTNGIGANPLITSAAVSFDNINDTNSTSIVNEFTFASPLSINAPFWASVEVENGSDSLSIASTPNGCGLGAIFNLNDTTWFNYGTVFTNGGNPISIAAHIWATVEDMSVGLDKNFISRSGLKFFPNPAHNNATIEFDMPNESNLTLVIQDMSGREVFRTEESFNAGNREFHLDLSSFATGTYTYQVVGEQSQLNGLFVKE